MRPTLRQLEYAIAVADHRHFRRAAEACHVTQPALSTQIAQLEETLGIRIFDRNRRRVDVTAAGEQILERARACLREADGLRDLANHLARPGAGPLRLGIIPTVAPYLLPDFLPAIRAEHPDYEVSLREDQTEALLARLDAGEIDLAFLALPIPGDHLQVREIGEEPFVLLTPGDHPLARSTEVHENELPGEELLLLAEGHCLRDHALAACQLPPRGSDGPMHANSLSMLVQMVRNRMGITLLPAAAIPVEATSREGLALRRFRDPEPSRMLGAAWRARNSREGEFDALCDLAASVVGTATKRALRSL
jgi:LysR family hydrogen peroxide-inducible transcriptional activator